MLIVSAHTANSDRPFSAVKTYSQTFAQRVVSAFEHAVIDRVAFVLPSATTGNSVKTFDDAYANLELVPPSIRRVVVHPGGHATLSGVATPGVEVEIRSHRRALGRTKVLSNGQWHLRLEAALDQGVHRMRSVAHLPHRGHQQPGQEVRIALPQSLSKPLVVLDEMDGLHDTVGIQALPAVHHHDVQGPIQVRQPDLRLVQTGGRGASRRDREARERLDDDRGLADPLFAWLQRSAIAYDRWIVEDLSGGKRGKRYVLRGRDRDDENDYLNDEFEDRSGRRLANRDGVTGLSERWQSFRVGVIEWFRQAQLSYRENVVEALSTGERVSRDRYARAEPDPDPPPRPRRREPEPTNDEDWTLPEPSRPLADEQPSTETLPQDKAPLSDWPVVREERFEPPPLPDVAPDPEKEALIRKAEEDAEKARQLARQAAEKAEAARKETEALLAEEKRLESDWAARRAAAKRAATEAELKRRADEAETRAAAAEARAKEAERLATTAQQLKEEQEARDAAQRMAAEELAAAASAAADREFAAGRVREPPAAPDVQPKIAETRPAKPAPQEFTVADAGTPSRLSIKDSAKDALIEEGSTLGDIDDFHPSVRYVYDMGDGELPKAKRNTKRSYKKRRAKTHKAKRKRSYRKHARKRRAAKVRGYRKRRARYKRRARVHRVYRRMYRRVQKFGRRYKFKPRRRVHYRRHAYARPVFIPRLRWRR